MQKNVLSPGVGLLALVLASSAVAAASDYKPTRARARPSVSASCSGFTMLEAEDARSTAKVMVKEPEWRREGLRQHRRFYRTACPDADATPLRHATPEKTAR